MRSSILDPVRGIRSAVLALLAVTSLAGCRAARTEVVLGLATDLDAPAEIDRVRLFVQRNGVELARQDWDLSGVPGVPVALPGSYGLYTDGATPHVEVALIGLRKQVEVLRRVATFTPVRGETTFMRLTLARSCLGVMCGDGQTCVEGRCAATEMEGASFPGYEPGMESALACASGTTFRDTSTRAPMPLSMPGTCAAGEHCREGTCYKGVVDAGVAPDPKDLAMPADLAVADLAAPDLAMPDLATSDLATRDLAMVMPDLTTRDMAMPDLAPPPDLSSSPDLSSPPDLRVTPPSWKAAVNFAPDGGVVTSEAAAIGDTSGDGYPELMAIGGGGAQLHQYLNMHNGTFSGPTVIATKGYARLASADLDGDGVADIAATTLVPDTQIYLSKANNVFSSAAVWSDAPRLDLLTVDVNGDGLRDVVQIDNAAQTSILSSRNTSKVGAISFMAPDKTLMTAAPSSFALGNFDGMAGLDALVGTVQPNQLSMMPADVTPGTFKANAAKTTTLPLPPYLLVTGDLDGDKKLDAIVTDKQGTLVILTGKGDGTFSQTSVTLPRADALALLDYNSDGNLDLALGELTQGVVWTYPGRGSGGLDFLNGKTSMVSGFVRQISVGDLDKNGSPDLVVVTNDGKINLLFNQYP